MNRLSRANLEACVSMAHPALVEVARAKATITYGDLMHNHMEGHPGRGYIAEVLETIAEIERREERPKLTAVVVRSNTGAVSGGFFGLAGTPNHLLRSSPAAWQDCRLSDADFDYWQGQLKTLYQYWQSHDS